VPEFVGILQAQHDLEVETVLLRQVEPQLCGRVFVEPAAQTVPLRDSYESCRSAIPTNTERASSDQSFGVGWARGFCRRATGLPCGFQPLRHVQDEARREA
jgi:hypothetical protein